MMHSFELFRRWGVEQSSSLYIFFVYCLEFKGFYIESHKVIQKPQTGRKMRLSARIFNARITSLARMI